MSSKCICLTLKGVQCSKHSLANSDRCKIHQKHACNKTILSTSSIKKKTEGRNQPKKKPSLKKKSLKKTQTQTQTQIQAQGKNQTRTKFFQEHDFGQQRNQLKQLNQAKQLKEPKEQHVVEKRKTTQKKVDIVHLRKSYDMQIDDFISFYQNQDNFLGVEGATMWQCESKQKNKKSILFLHDIHRPFPTKTGKSFIVYNFLDDLFIKSQTCIDFMLETTNFYLDAANLSSHSLNAGLVGTMKKFSTCLDIKKSGCFERYPFTRFHNIEIRRESNQIYSFDTESVLTLPLFYFQQPNKKNIDHSEFTAYIKAYMKMYDHSAVQKSEQLTKFVELLNGTNNREPFFEMLLIGLLDADMKKIHQFFHTLVTFFPGFTSTEFQQYYTFEKIQKHVIFHKISKQMNALKNNVDLASLRAFFIQEFHIFFAKLRERLDYPEITFLVFYRNFVFDFGIFVNDIYTILRLLKIVFIYNDSSLVVCYAGREHTLRLQKWCKQWILAFELVAHIGSDTNEEILRNPWIQLQEKHHQGWQALLNHLSSVLKQRSTNCAIKTFTSKNSTQKTQYNTQETKSEIVIQEKKNFEKKKPTKYESTKGLKKELTKELTKDSFLWGPKLGQGAFSEVFQATNLRTGEKVAIKRLSKLFDDLSVRTDIDAYVEKEVKVLQYLKPHCSKYILCYKEMFKDSDYFYIVMENLTPNFMAFEDVLSKTLQSEGKIIVNLIMGLKVMHSLDVAHRDLHPGNILVNTVSGDIKYIDFGAACVKELCQTNLNKKLNDLKKGDIWDVGLIIYSFINKIHESDFFAANFPDINFPDDRNFFMKQKHKFIEIRDIQTEEKFQYYLKKYGDGLAGISLKNMLDKNASKRFV